MQLRQLALVPPAPRPAAAPDSTVSTRKVFWRAFLDWLAVAPGDEAEQLERVLSGHAHHVRPLIDAVSDAMASPVDSQRLPPGLLASLAARGWRPAPASDRACHAA